MEASNPGKIIFPGGPDRAAISKGELVEYYNRVAPKMLPMVADRPLTLHRFPNGIGAKGFMQKNVAKHFPSSIGRYEVPKREGGNTVYPVVTNADDIAWLANQGTVTFHIWTSTVDSADGNPDWLVLDLDPPEESSSDQSDTANGHSDTADIHADVHAAAAATKAVLEEFGLDSHPVATGSKGFHLWVALDGTQTANDVATANRSLAGLVASRHPDMATTEFLKRDRNGRVFIDWLRANRGATVVAPLSLRAKDGAPVATPLDWGEVDETAPDQWTINNIDQLLERPSVVDRASERHQLPVEAIVAEARSAGVDLDTPFDRFGRKR